MPLIKVIVQEERTRYTANDVKNDEVTYWETQLEITATDPGVIAGTLRAMADKYSPVTAKATYRGE